MNEPAYPLTISADSLNYTFDSISEYILIHKAIEYRPFSTNAIFYNLALVDVQDDGTTSDLAVSNNQDMNRIMDTVFQSLLTFFGKYPNKLVYVEGSDKAGLRTPLYRVLISRELEQAKKLFEIYGQFSDNSYEEFTPNRPYTAFIFQLKHLS